MTRFRYLHSAWFPANITLALLITTAAVSLNAQGRRDTGENGTDIHLHKFQPRMTPEQVSQPVPGQSADSFAAQQIVAIEQEKNSRTPAQQKIDSNLLYTIRMMRGQAAAPGVPFLYTGVDLDQNDNLVVDITANVTDSLMQQLNAAKVLVWYSNADFHSIRAVVSPNELENIAASPDVIFISPKMGSITAGTGFLRTKFLRPGFAQRAARIRKQLAAALAAKGITGGPKQGSVDSQGDTTHRAADARSTFSVNGSGLKIGVLSDSANATGALTAAQASGDMPPTCPAGPPCFTLVQDFGSGTDEGTAMMEIIYDLAPGASLFFATADVSEASFATNIQNLQSVSHCDIIVDDVFYFDEPVFQDGIVAQAVNTVTAAGALYFSSAGNEGNVDSNTAGYFEGDFNDTGSPAFTFPGGAKTGTIHNFGTVPTPVNGDIITAKGSAYTLNWSDPQGASGNDYDLFLVDSTGTIKAQSTNIQNGTQNPFEQINPPALAAGDRLVVFKTAAAAVRAFAINTIRGTLTVVTTGQTHGHSAASGTGIYSVAATPAAGPFNNGSPTGPFPNPFNSSNVVELFSSDGPRRVFYNANGTAITPGNVLFGTNGGTVRSKPDITAADGVSTTLPANSGLNPFYGTSAAAPHAAAVAALVKSFNPALTQTQIRTALTSTAIDIMAAGPDRDSGAGIVMAWEAINSLSAPGGPDLQAITVTASENPGDGDGVIEAGEGGKLVVTLKNAGGSPATGISATLTTSTPGVTMTLPGASAYPTLAAGASASNSTPFAFTVASNASCALVINFVLTVNYTGAAQPTVLNMSVQTGIFNLTAVLDGTTTPATVTGITATTGTQTGRLSRTGVASTCAAPKSNPGLVTAVGSRAFNAYTITSACKTGCLNAVMTSSNGSNLYEAAYTSAGFVPSNPSTNYLADSGSSSGTQTMGFNVTSGQANTLVVHDINITPASGSTYTLQVPACFVSCSINQVPVAVVHNVTVTSAVPGGSANANIDNGSSDPDGDTLTFTQTPAGPYPHGTTTVMLTVTDPKGASAQASATVTVNDPAVPAPDMTIIKNHVGNFTQGQTGAYTITVTNSGNAVTVGTVTVTDTPPSGLTATTASGTGWTCPVAAGTMTCTRNDALAASASYPPITLNVNVANNAPASVTNTAVVSGGGEVNTSNDTVSDPTTVNPPADVFTITPTTPSASTTAGQAVTEHITFAANPPTGSAASLMCSTLPALTTCSFVPSSVPAGTTNQDVAVSINTTATTKAALQQPRTFYAAWLPGVGFGLGLIGMIGIAARRKNRKAAVVLAVLSLTLLLFGLAGCGGHHTIPGTPPGSYTVTVTASTATTTKTTTFTLVVQ